MAAAAISSISAVVSYVSSAFAATAAGTATLGQSAAVFAISAAANIGVAAIMAPQVGAGGSPTEWSADPDAPEPFVMGRRGVAGKIVHRKAWGKDNRYQSLVSVLSCAGPINRFESFTADGETCTFSGPYGRQTSGTWKDIFWRDTRLGNQPDTALQTPLQKGDPTVAGPALPNWGASHRISGKACTMVTAAMDAKRERWAGDIPHCLNVIEGIFGYDPRQDSTYPGGSGPCRANDPSTWVYTVNGAIGALTFALGFWENGEIVGGMGAHPSRIDMPAYVELANIADANGWIMSAAWTSADNKHQVLTAFLQSAGGLYAQNGGLISCVSRGAPRTSIATISARDTAGPVEIAAAASRLQRINAIVPRCVQEAQKWQLVPLDEVSVAAFEDEDGEKRSRGIDYVFVPETVQASQLAAYDICDSREGITGRLPLKPYMRDLKPGDAFTITEPEFVLDGLKCVVLKRDFNTDTSIVTLTFRSETDAKHPFALGLSPTPPTAPSLTPANPNVFPQPPEDDWSAAPITIDGPNGETRPAVELTGGVTTVGTRLVEVQYRYRLGEGAWTAWAVAGTVDADTTRVLIEGVPPGAEVETAVVYISLRGVRSTEPRLLDPVFVSTRVISTDTSLVGGIPASTVQDFVDDLGNLALTVMQEALDRRSEIRRNIADVWSTFGTAQSFLDGVIAWTDQAELYSIAASESATAAENSATAAAGWAAQAQTYADEAGNSASAANLSAIAAADSATAAGNSAGAAAGWAAQAQTYADAAGNSASAASLSATAAASSANDAGESASAAAQFVLDAQSWADAAEQYSSATLTLKTEAETAANQASSSATQAANSSTAAASAASIAEDHAQTAEGFATSASTSAASADGSASEAAQSAIVTAVYGASAKQDVVDAADYFTQSLNTLAFADGVLTHWIEEVVTGVGTVVYSENNTANFCARARFRPVPGRRYRCTASWRWVSGTVGTVEVGFRADAADGSGAIANRWSPVTAGTSGEWREASYEITATEAMALESWRPVIRRSGNTGRMEIRALVWEDLSALRAVGQDTVAVYSTRDEAMAARIIQVSAGDAFAAIQLAARQANGTASSVLRFAAQLFGFGEDFDTPRFFIDAVSNAIYGTADDGTTRVFEIDFANDGRLKIWKADGTLQFDSEGGGVLIDGVKEGLVGDSGRHFTASHTWLTGSPVYTASNVHNFSGTTNAMTIEVGDEVDLNWSYEVVLPANSAKWVYFWEVIKRDGVEIRRVSRHVGAGQSEGNVSGNQSSAGEDVRPAFSANMVDLPAAGAHTYTISIEKRAVGGQYIDGGQASASGMTLENINLKALAQRAGPTRIN